MDVYTAMEEAYKNGYEKGYKDGSRDYEELREAFVDFACSGIHNLAPYCKNKSEKCVDSYGYCVNVQKYCMGFNPDGRNVIA